MTAVRNLVGKTFGNWAVIERSSKTDSRQNAYWRCRCRCGDERDILGGNLRRGNTTSCGCEADLKALTPLRDRGLIGTPEYRAWIQMKRRCYDPNYTRWDQWGGRDITVCQEWRDSFDAFLAYVGPRPGIGWSLDRIDNDGNYGPGNVRWATRKMQANNRRNNVARRPAETPPML